MSTCIISCDHLPVFLHETSVSAHPI